ncbi:AsmA family protein [Acidiphilium sp. PA]|uniref:AsmA family protein n=1 Tax=Acidiphilium sp. PA TaxID=2871705 RepID=UPI00224395ED|nr:AsmA family protein [Acidiphilium sp. PA]MCW8307482.1 AsmA family protein [Acidiphilium sp. PA]
MQKSSTVRRVALIVVALVIVVPVAALAIFVATFNPNSYKPRIIAAVEQATGRQLTIAGPLHMTLSLVPTISASGITLANPPGYADADMASLQRIEAQVALLPLLSHRIDIIKLALIDPVITLEYGPTGTPNWLFDHPSATPGASGTAPAPAPAKSTHGIALQSVSIENGTITYKPPAALVPLQPGQAAAAAAPTVLNIAHFTGSAASLAAPLHLSTQAQYDSQPFTLTGTTGPVSRLSGGAGAWPVDVTLGAQNATLRLKGSIAHPRHLKGYALDVHAAIPDLAALDPYAGGMNLPPLQTVAFSASITQADQATPGLPTISNASLTAGRSDLDTWRKGLSISSLNATMTSLDQPLSIALAGAYQGKPVGLEGTAGPLGPILTAALDIPIPQSAARGTVGAAGATERFAVNLAAKVGNAQFGVAGGIASPEKLAGVALKITAQVPNLAHLSDLAGQPLPAWTNIGLSGLLTDPGGQGLSRAVGLESLAVTADQGQFGGAFSLTQGATPDLQAVINAPRIDLTALLRAMPKPATAGATAPQATVPPSATQAGDLIPATPLPFGLLRRGNGNVELTIGQLMYDGATYDAITAHGLLHDGVLNVRPITAELPGGSITGTVAIDAKANPPRVHVTEAAPAFRLAPLLTVLGLPNSAAATVQLYANLAGQGNTPRGIAATLNGTLGVSTVNGEIDGTLLDRLFGSSLSAVGLPASMVGAQGPVMVRCFAGRLDARNGLANVRALTLDSSRMYLTGTGSLDLGAERLNLILRPTVRVGTGSAPIPISVSGTFAHPREGIAPAGDYGATAAALAQQLGHNGGTVLGRLAQNLGLAPKPADPQSCTGALALARLGNSGPMPSGPAGGMLPAPVGGAGGGAPASGPQNLLRSLFH